MKHTIRSGAVIDIPTVDEFLRPMTDTIKEHLGKNAHFVRDTVATLASSVGSMSIQNGPPDGFIWNVMLVNVDPGSGTLQWNLYINNVANSNIVAPSQTGVQVVAFGAKQLILKHGDVLIAQSFAGAGTNFYNTTMTLHVIEVPAAHEAQLLL